MVEVGINGKIMCCLVDIGVVIFVLDVKYFVYLYDGKILFFKLSVMDLI